MAQRGSMLARIRSHPSPWMEKCLDALDVSHDEVVERVYMNLINARRKALEEKLCSSAKVDDRLRAQWGNRWEKASRVLEGSRAGVGLGYRLLGLAVK